MGRARAPIPRMAGSQDSFPLGKRSRSSVARANFSWGQGDRRAGRRLHQLWREDSDGFAGRIYDRLTNRLGRKNVFFDVDAIPPGLDFVDVLSERVGKCDVLLAIIGKHWVSSADSQNGRRLDDPGDFVRIEIEAALNAMFPSSPGPGRWRGNASSRTLGRQPRSSPAGKPSRFRQPVGLRHG